MFEYHQDILEMQVRTTTDRRHVRHEETRRSIVAAACELTEHDGVAGLSLGKVGRVVGMRTQSLYSYFDSKHALYDAMYRRGFEELVDRFEDVRPAKDAQAFLAMSAERFIDFAAERPSRFQLMFQRTVPGFEPTKESFAIAEKSLDMMRSSLHEVGISAESDLDLWRALLLGLAAEQLANDPGGRRWRALSRNAARYFIGFVRARRDKR